MNFIKILILIAVINSNIASAQEKTGFAVDLGAKNIAALFTMTNEQGRIRNLELMENIFTDGSLGFESQRYHNVSSPFIYKKLNELAKNLDDNASLILYFNSHGGGSGNRFAMTAEGGSFKFSKALESLGAANKKIRRLIILVDTCHAQGSIQDGLKQDGQLLKNIMSASPTNYLNELPSKITYADLPFASIFLDGSVANYGESSNAYEELLIISSCSVEDLSVRGVFASRLNKTFEEVKKNKKITVKEFLKKFADNHEKYGQQPYYKVLPNEDLLEEMLFSPYSAQLLPVFFKGKKIEVDSDYIPMPHLK